MFFKLKKSVYTTAKTASISTATPNGKDGAPTANLACLPCSPSAATIRSEAPLMILGWSVKSGVQFTKPPSLTQRSTLLQSPSTAAFTWARMFRAQARAASMP